MFYISLLEWNVVLTIFRSFTAVDASAVAAAAAIVVVVTAKEGKKLS